MKTLKAFVLPALLVTAPMLRADSAFSGELVDRGTFEPIASSSNDWRAFFALPERDRKETTVPVVDVYLALPLEHQLVVARTDSGNQGRIAAVKEDMRCFSRSVRPNRIFTVTRSGT